MLDILVIEDCDEINDLYRDIFDTMGLQYRIFREPRDLMAFFHHKQLLFKILIFDLELNRGPLDGNTVCSYLKICNNDFIPVAVTGTCDSESIRKSHPDYDVIEKPFRVNDFILMINSKLAEFNKPESEKIVC